MGNIFVCLGQCAVNDIKSLPSQESAGHPLDVPCGPPFAAPFEPWIGTKSG